jgi:hypothetical protein
MLSSARVSSCSFSNLSIRVNVAAMLASLVGLVLIAQSALAETRVFLDSSGNKFVFDTTAPPAWASVKAPPTKQLTATFILFNVTYDDVETHTGNGFDDPTLGAARRATVDLALEYIDSVLNESGTCDVKFNVSELDGSGYLATGGTSFSTTPGFTNGEAFEAITSVDPSPSTADIFVTVDFGHNWNAGTSPPSPFQFDLLSVMIHELTHGLGFLSLSTSTGTSVIAPGVFSFWDRELETGNGRDLWHDGTAAFQGIPTDLTGNDNGVVFVGTNATSTYGSTPPVYAPPTFSSGSSLSHWDPAVPGRAIMEPSTPTGVTFREYLIVEIGALKDIGYTNAAEPLPEVDFSSSLYTANEQDGMVTITVQLSAAPGTGNTAQVDYATSNGSAKQGTDYTATSGTLTFGATETERTFNVGLINDADPEITETLYLTLSNPVDATLAGDNNPATLRIFDDDPGLSSFVVPFFRQKQLGR